MKLVTYDRRGHRRLGALTGGRVVDLPDAVGHPAFPTTLEALIARNGGTVLDVARESLGRDDVMEFVVSEPRLLVPLLPSSIRAFMTFEGHARLVAKRTGLDVAAIEAAPLYSKRNHRSVVGPDEDLAWPPFTEALDFEFGVAAVLGRWGRDLSSRKAAATIFGFTIANDWVARDLEAHEMATPLGPGKSRDFATSIGPCVVTPDEVDPSGVEMIVRVDGKEWSRGCLGDARWEFPQMVAHVSRGEEVWPGDVYVSGPFRGGCAVDLGRELRPGATLELEARGIGVLRNRVGPKPPPRH